MKNKYKQHLNSFTLTQEVKEEVKEAVEHYNRKKLSNKRKVVLATSMAIIVGIALLNASDVFNDNKRHSFVIKADEGVTIAYDKQNDDHYLYGIALTAKASELFVNTTSAEYSEQRDEELKKVIKKAFSEVAINVRVNYVDGSVETQKLVFNTDDLGIPVLNKWPLNFSGSKY